MSQPTVTQVLDDRSDDITFFSSSASWNHESNPLEFNQTATWTQTAGDSLSIPFNGTSISVFGTLDSTDFPPVQTSYELDDIPAVIQTNSSFLAQTQFQQKFYESPVLDPGVHTLTITNLANGSTFRFDFVKVTSPNPAFQTAIVPPSLTPTTTSFSAASTQDSSSSSSDATDSTDSTDSVSIVGPMTLQAQTSSLPTSTLDTTTSIISGTASNSDANTSSTAVSASGGTGNGAHLAAILGGILGGVGFLVWIVVFLLIQRRRRQRINRTRRMSEFLRRSSEKRTYQSNFTPVRRHDSQDMSSFGTPDPLVPNYVTTSDSSSSSASATEGRPPTSRYELTPFTGEPTPEIERLPPERSAWSPEPPGRREGKKRGYFYVDSPPKYNSGQFYHLES